MATKAASNGKVDSEILVCQILGIKSLKPEQKKSMIALGKGEDCFLC